MGLQNTASGEASTAMGLQNTASGEASTAMGLQNTASGQASTAMGYLSMATGGYSLAAGYGSKTVSAGAAAAIGSEAEANGYAAISLGQQTEAGTNAVALGYKTKAMAKGSTATGYGSEALGEGSFAGGGHVTTGDATGPKDGGKAYGDSSFAFGMGAVAGVSGQATEYGGTIAMGNGARAVHKNSLALGNNSVTVADNTLAVGNGSDVFRRITGVADGTANTDAVTVGQVNTMVQTQVAAQVSAGGTFTVEQLAAVNSGVTADKVASLEGAINGLSFADNKLSYTTVGNAIATDIDLSGLTGVDAYTKDETDNKFATRTEVADISSQIGRMGTRISKVGAGAAALAAMHPVYDEESKLTFSAGVGNYKSETAAAVGMFYRFDDRVMLNLGASVGNDNDMYNVGLNFALGHHVKKGLPAKEVLHREIISLQTLLEEQKAENAAMKQENDSMRKKMLAQDAKMAAYDAKVAAQDVKIEQLMQIVQELLAGAKR